EIRAWLEPAFGERPSASSPAQVGALVVLGWQLMNEGDYDRSRTVLEQAVADAQRFEGWADAAVALTYLAWLAAAAGEYDADLRLGTEAVEVARRAGDLWAERQGLAMVAGALVNQGRHGEARPYLDRSLALARRLDDPATLVLATVNRGFGAIAAGELTG